jgi:hypothetical protein
MPNAETLERLRKVLFPAGASLTKARDSGEIIAPAVGPAAGVPPKNTKVSYAKPKKPKKSKSSAIELAKSAIDRGVTEKSSAYFYTALEKRAEKLRQPDETTAAAMTRGIVEDDKGKALYKAMQVSAGVAVTKMAPVDDSPVVEADAVAGFKPAAEAELDKQAKRRMKADPSLSYAVAYSQIFELPENKALRDTVRNDGLLRQLRGMGGVI